MQDSKEVLRWEDPTLEDVKFRLVTGTNEDETGATKVEFIVESMVTDALDNESWREVDCAPILGNAGDGWDEAMLSLLHHIAFRDS